MMNLYNFTESLFEDRIKSYIYPCSVDKYIMNCCGTQKILNFQSLENIFVDNKILFEYTILVSVCHWNLDAHEVLNLRREKTNYEDDFTA